VENSEVCNAQTSFVAANALLYTGADTACEHIQRHPPENISSAKFGITEGLPLLEDLIQRAVLLIITPCITEINFRYFGGKYYFHLQINFGKSCGCSWIYMRKLKSLLVYSPLSSAP
jgi:hypothetical protein